MEWIPTDIEHLDIISGYKVYFNEQAVTDIIHELQYTDYIQPGRPRYYISAVYINGSEASSEEITLINN